MDQQLLEYAPPIFSIYLILISDVFSLYLRRIVGSLLGPKWKKSDDVKLVKEIVLDALTRVNFVVSVVSAVITIVITYSTARALSGRDQLIEGILLISILAIFVAMLFWIFSHEAGELAGTQHKLLGFIPILVTPARHCDLALIVINVALIAAVANKQGLI
jgi:hypothetical protein